MTTPAAPDTPEAPATPETPAEPSSADVIARLEADYAALEDKAKALLLALERMAGRNHLSLNVRESAERLFQHVVSTTGPAPGDADPTKAPPAAETAEQAAGESDPTPEAEPAAPSETAAPAATPEADPPAPESPGAST